MCERRNPGDSIVHADLGTDPHTDLGVAPNPDLRLREALNMRVEGQCSPDDAVKMMRARLDLLMKARPQAIDATRALEIDLEMDELMVRLVQFTGGTNQLQHWIQ